MYQSLLYTATFDIYSVQLYCTAVLLVVVQDATPDRRTSSSTMVLYRSAAARVILSTVQLRPIASVLYRDIYTVRAARLNLLLSHMQPNCDLSSDG